MSVDAMGVLDCEEGEAAFKEEDGSDEFEDQECISKRRRTFHIV